MDEKNNKTSKQNNTAGKVPEIEEKVSISKKEYDELIARREEKNELEDKMLRAHAEFENARKRVEKDRIDFAKYANERMILEFLPILDNLEIAEKHIKEAKDFKAVQEGVDMIQIQIQEFMKDLGVERIKSEGEKFDPHIHEPLMVDPASDKEDGIILEELKPGYRLNGRLLRPAMVKIAKSNT